MCLVSGRMRRPEGRERIDRRATRRRTEQSSRMKESSSARRAAQYRNNKEALARRGMRSAEDSIASGSIAQMRRAADGSVSPFAMWLSREKSRIRDPDG